jgi:hypothetical protein
LCWVEHGLLPGEHLVEQHDEWQISDHRHLSEDTIVRLATPSEHWSAESFSRHHESVLNRTVARPKSTTS